MEVLIIGEPFYHLTTALNETIFSFDTCTEKELLLKIVDTYDVIVYLKFSSLLNSAQFENFQYCITKSKKEASIIFWTHEPFWDQHLQKRLVLFGKVIHFMNCYTGDVFSSIYSFYFGIGGYLWSDRYFLKLDMPEKDFIYKRFETGRAERIVGAYATCFHGVIHESPNQLISLRNDLIKWMYDNYLCDVYGKNWNHKWKLHVTSETRMGTSERSWGNIKVTDSRKIYSFAIAIENCLIDNYVTEKFAHAIESWNIPIYCFENNLSSEMDTSAAINISSKANEDEFVAIFNLIVQMSFNEYWERLNELIHNYNKVICKEKYINEERKKPANTLVKKISTILKSRT
jgi:hypothetical protein